MQKSMDKSRNREKNFKSSFGVKEAPHRPDQDGKRFGGSNAMKENTHLSSRSQSHWNKLWVPPSSGNEWGKSSSSQGQFQPLAGSNLGLQWNADIPSFHSEIQFQERLSSEPHFNHGSIPMGEPFVNNSMPWNPSVNPFPQVSNQLEQLEELNAYYQFKLKKLQKQKKQSHEEIAQLNHLASILKESLALHNHSMKQQQDLGYPLIDPLYDAGLMRANEILCNGTVFYDQGLDYLPDQQVNWRHDNLRDHKASWGNSSLPLTIPNRGQSVRNLDYNELGRKSPGSGSPKAVSDFPGLMTREFSPNKFRPDVVNSDMLLPSQDELDFHLAMVQYS